MSAEVARLQAEIDLCSRELAEARQQQSAMAEVLKAISRSDFDLQVVLNAVVESASRLCGASFGQLYRWDGTLLHWAAGYALTPEFLDTQRDRTYRPGRDSLSGRTALNMRVTVIDDAWEDPEYGYKDHARIGNFRTMLGVPLLRSGELIGVLGLVHQHVEPFTDRQIELVTTFADQAVIAIGNARMFEELQARNRDITEALDQQTATGAILRTIAGSPADVEPVLDAVAESAARLCEAHDVVVLLAEGNMLIPRAHHGPIPLNFIRRPIGRDWVTGRAFCDCKPVQVDDITAERDEYPSGYALAERFGWRTILAVPLVREDKAIGVIAMRRGEMRPFSQKQVDLLVLFADQAVIAIENANLFEALRLRNRDLSEALEQQTATGTILRAIAASPTDVQPVLKTVAESAARLCDAYDAVILLADGDALTLRAHHGPIPVDFMNWPIARDWVTGRAFIDRTPVHVQDLVLEKEEFPAGQAMAERLGHRTILAIPLLREDKAIGALTLRRREVRPFSRKQIELLILFADQAAIAIENARLFEELQGRNRELTEAMEREMATGAILRAIAASPTDVGPVLDTVAESAAKLCEARDAAIVLAEGDVLVLRAHHGPIPIDFNKWSIGRDWVSGRAYTDRKPIHVHDIMQEGDDFLSSRAAAERLGFRTILGVPMLREGKAIGAVLIRRDEVRPFSQKQIDLLIIFADQAAIAIENSRLFGELQARNRDLTDAIERQTATAEVLKAISRTTFDLPAVLRTLVASAARLCGAGYGGIMLREGDKLRGGAIFAGTPEDEADMQSRLVPIDRSRISGRVVLSGHIEQIEDVLADPDYDSPFLTRVSNVRALMGVPLLRKGTVEGVFFLGRPEPGTFSQHQSDLVQTFADQAVIAIENVRLFEEVKARTGELSESLQQQIATADVLKAISRSTFDLHAVLNTLVESAARLCGANIAQIFRWDGACLRWAAGYALGPEYLEIQRERTYRLGQDSLVGRVGRDKRTMIIEDVLDDPDYAYKDHAKIGQIRTLLGVPLLRSGELIGVIALAHQRVEPFTEKQIELVTTFADQAVIAIENVRLFEEVQARTRELQETLDYQTAIGEVLNVISRSPADVQPVLDVILQTAVRLCDADGGTVARERDGVFFRSGQVGFSSEFTELMLREPVAPSRGTITGRTLVEGKVVQIDDAETDPEYTWIEAQKLGELHTLLGVPLLRDKTTIGVIALIRRTVRPFTEKQIELVTTFADQAVIAIENARLFEEVQARTADLARSVGELRALGEVSQSVNSTLDLKTVLETIVTKAVQLSGTEAGAIYVYSAGADRFRLRATYGMSAELIAAITDQAIRLNDPGIGDAARSRQPVQTEDLAGNIPTPVHRIVLEAGFRSVLVVPLLRPHKVVGALVVRRRAPGRFSDSTVRLMETFAAQSVLAIQNARLFSEIEEKGRQLEIASRHKSQFLANMSHELRTPLNSVLGFTEMLADGLYGDLPEKAKATLGRVQANGRHLLGLINDVLDLSKIEAGQLVLSIDDYAIGQMVRTVVATTEPLARAKGLSLSTTIAQGLPLGRGDERRLCQVLLNLAGNAVKFTESGAVEIAAMAQDGRFEILVRDTGPGIAPEHQARIFEEFQQVDESSTRLKGGTGLGLAISKRIVEMHGGTIGVDSAPGSGSTFRVSIPIKVDEGLAAA